MKEHTKRIGLRALVSEVTQLADSGVQGYLPSKRMPLPQDPTVGLCIGSYRGPREGGRLFYERGTPVPHENA